MTSAAQSKSTIFQAQAKVAELLNSCPDLSATPFWPEDALDIEYQVRDALQKQGLACMVMTPRLDYQGRCGDSTAWDMNALELLAVENPQVNRAREDAMTALDVVYRAVEWLAGPDSPTRGMFTPVTIRQGEEQKRVVVTAELKALLHDEREDPSKTKITLEDGTVEKYDVNGPIDTDWLIDNGFIAFEDSWKVLKPIKALECGEGVTALSAAEHPKFRLFRDTMEKLATSSTTQTIGDTAFYNMTQLTSVTLAEGLKTIEDSAFAGCQFASLVVPASVETIGNSALELNANLSAVAFSGRTLAQVQAMANYPWGIPDESVISAEL